MSKIVIENSKTFENIISSFENSILNIKNIFENENNNMEKINETEIWTGKIQKTMYGKYAELKENYNSIEESLKIYVKFMKKTLEDYTNLEKQINTSIEKNDSSLNVNS